MKREFSKDEMEDLMDIAVEVSSAHWRHGRKILFVWKCDGEHWAAWFNSHHEEGIELDGPVTGVKVHQVERVVLAWEPVP